MIVLDTRIWFWWISREHARLSAGLLEALESEPLVGVSAVSCFEIALAARRGRVELPLPAREWIEEALTPSGIELLPLSAAMSARAVSLPEHHRDPFDRMIIAAALELDARLASVDSMFRQYAELTGRLLA